MYGTDDGCLGLRALIAPASGTIHYHNCYDGGYIDHVMNVCKAARGQKVLMQSMGARIDFTDDELLFSALNHDLGKLGSLEGEQYQPNDSEWHIKNQGKVYLKHCKDIPICKLFLIFVGLLHNQLIQVLKKLQVFVMVEIINMDS